MGKFIQGQFGGYNTYASKEFTITGAQENYNVKTQQSTFTTAAERIVLRVDTDVTIKLNSTGNDSITVTSADGFDSAGLVVNLTNLYITTTGNTAVKLLIVPGAAE
jgi:hypothetical protein